jgi:ribosomal-protein-alanine N-acetyltransferase
MAFLRSSRVEDEFDGFMGRTVMLRMPQPSDYAAWTELRSLSRAHLVPWEPAWTADDLSRAMYRKRLRAYAKDVRDDLCYPYFLFDLANERLLGGITLSNVRRGSAQSASLGYWMGATFAGQGRMQEAVRTLVPAAFSVLRLNRIEAATMPANAASIRVLENCGFEREGLAKSYLKINGRFEDHFLYARVSSGGAGYSARPRGAAD